MDKLVLGFMADVLYLKEVICYEEFEAIQNVTNAEELGDVFEKMIRGEYNVYKRGERVPKS
jgi:hypothetical protein